MISVKTVWHGVSQAVRVFYDRSYRQDVQQYFEQMRKEGVDPADSAARRAWIRAHRKELKPIATSKSNAPSIHSEPKVGRNDPCPCDSGRKYKKCCAPKNS